MLLLLEKRSIALRKRIQRETSIIMGLGRRIAKYVERRQRSIEELSKLDQRTIAKQLGLSQSMISKYLIEHRRIHRANKRKTHETL